MSLETTTDGNTAGMNHATAAHAHASAARRRQNHVDAREVLHATEECMRQATRASLTADAIRRGSLLPQQAAITRSNRELLPCCQRSRASKRKKWCDTNSRSCT